MQDLVITKITFPVKEFGYFVRCYSGDGVEQIVNRTLIYDPCRSCGVAVKTILQNVIPRTPNSIMRYDRIRPGIIHYKWLHMCMIFYQSWPSLTTYMRPLAAMSWRQAVNHYLNMGCSQLIDVETTWLPRYRQHFHTQFVKWIYESF